MEHNHETKKGITEKILSEIKEKRVSMRPKFYFTLETLLVGLVALMILLVSIAIVSFILFGIRINGHESLLAFGPRGIEAFLLLFPWPLLILDALLVFFLEKLLRRFKFGYRSPILYLLVALIVIAGALGLVVDRGTSVNDDLLRHAEHGELFGPFEQLYGNARVRAPHDRGIYRGTILEIGTSSIRMAHEDLDQDTDDTGYVVLLPPNFESQQLSIGEQVYVAGDRKGTSTIQAFGIHMLPNRVEIIVPATP